LDPSRCIDRFLLFTTLLVPGISWSFPEMIRHGYANCAACHFNPAGGGVLTPYGKSISSEVLSRWSYAGEERIFHGALSKNASSYLQGENEISAIVGGDVRYLQLHQENSSIRRRKFFLMQADLEAGAKWKDLILLSTFGQENVGDTKRWRFRKTSINATFGESYHIKVGRAHPNLGLMVSEHFLSSRSDSGLHPLEYKDLVEAQATFEKYEFVLGAETSPYERDDGPNAETGFYAQAAMVIASKYKFGLHYWTRNADAFSKHRIGAHAMLGFTRKLAFLADYQFQQEYLLGQSRHWGFFGSGKLTYEPFKGFWASLWLDYQQRNLDDNSTGRERFGPGIQFFPRPHFELEALWMREYSHQRDSWGDYAMLVLHYYL
jgi:hypothetical protein